MNLQFINEILEKAKLYNSFKNNIPDVYSENFEKDFSVDYAHNSTAIEGNTLSLIETKLLLEDKISVGGKALRELYEVTNHQKAYEFIKDKIRAGEVLNEDLVKDIHAILTENIFVGGIYRQASARITGASFEPPCGELMFRDIKMFYADFNWMKTRNPIEYAAWTHAEFVRIHPFPDGNGRTARMIMNYQLMSNGLLPISIQKENRLEYYKALDVYATEKNLEPFIEFVAKHENEMLADRLKLGIDLNLISDLDIQLAVADATVLSVNTNTGVTGKDDIVKD